MTQVRSIDGDGKVPHLATNGDAGQRKFSEFGQIVLVLQGGGALGAYQAGVYQALHDSGVEPDWVIGTSIGAINASLIVGNKPEQRLAKLKEFWNCVGNNPILEAAAVPGLGRGWLNWMTLTTGISGFLQPNPLAFLGLHVPLPVDAAGYYSTHPLEATLSDLVDFTAINGGPTRLTVGSANIQTGEMRYFDSRDTKLTVHHVMASGALPPAFPAVRIGPFQHASRGGIRRQPSPQLARVRCPYVESGRTRAGDGQGGPEPSQGRPIFEPRRQSH